MAHQVHDFRRPRRPLQGFPLPESLLASNNIKEVAKHGNVLLMVIPTPFVGRTVSQITDACADDAILVSCTKGGCSNLPYVPLYCMRD
jgi:glycerol-3-phosphate dehydrogenase (NAD(P)+)